MSQAEEMIAAHDAATGALLAALDNSDLSAAKSAAGQLLAVDQIIADIAPRYTDGRRHSETPELKTYQTIQANVEYRTESMSASIANMLQHLTAADQHALNTVRKLLTKNPKGS